MGNVIKLPLSDSGISQQIRGTVAVGDIAGNPGALIVTGGLTSASAAVPTSSTTNITLNFPSIPNPIVSIVVESLGTDILDNDITIPIVRNLTNTSMEIFIEETGPVGQNITLHIVITAQ